MFLRAQHVPLNVDLQAQTVLPNACGRDGSEDHHLSRAGAPAPAQTLFPGAAGKEVARTQADTWSTKLTCLAEGSLRSTKCHLPVQSINLRFPGQDLKGTVALWQDRKKQYCSGAAGETHVFCPIRLSAYLLFPCTGKQVWNLYPHYLHAFRIILNKQRG